MFIQPIDYEVLEGQTVGSLAHTRAERVEGGGGRIHHSPRAAGGKEEKGGSLIDLG